MSYELRPYQEKAVASGLKYLKGPYLNNGLMILPTGSGKSLVIANIIRALAEPVLIFQPSKEILEQNHAKFTSYGYTAGIYSASKGRKQIYPATFATIGSVVRNPQAFRPFKYIIIDECHGVNPQKGMYKEFLKALGGARVLGLTATPYRLVSDRYGGSILKFLTRTRPRIFTDLIYYINNNILFDAGFLSPIKYVNTDGFDRRQLRLNSTGADFSDLSVKAYYNKTGFIKKIANVVDGVMQERKNTLVFTRYIGEAQYIVDNIPGSAIVTAQTSKRERERIIAGFRAGAIKVVANVGVLTTGFDYPELESIVLARPTMSLALYYQMVGRGIRVHPEKPNTLVVDMCGNVDMFGPVEDLRIINGGRGKWFIANKRRQLTNLYFGR